MKEYKNLKPSLLKFAKEVIRRHKQEEQVYKVLDWLSEQKKEETYINPPHRWWVEGSNEKEITFTNYLFFINILQEGDMYKLEVLPCPYGPRDAEFSWPILESKALFDTPFEAMHQAILKISYLDDEYDVHPHFLEEYEHENSEYESSYGELEWSFDPSNKESFLAATENADCVENKLIDYLKTIKLTYFDNDTSKFYINQNNTIQVERKILTGSHTQSQCLAVTVISKDVQVNKEVLNFLNDCKIKMSVM